MVHQPWHLSREEHCSLDIKDQELRTPRHSCGIARHISCASRPAGGVNMGSSGFGEVLECVDVCWAGHICCVSAASAGVRRTEFDVDEYASSVLSQTVLELVARDST